MTENEHLEKIKQLAAMKELPILDELALLEFQLSKGDPLQIEEEYVNAYIPITFDANKAFGLDIGQDNDDNIDLYAEWRVGEVDSLAMYVTYRNNSTVDGDFYFHVPLDERQQQCIHTQLEEQCRTVYGKSIADMVREANRQEEISIFQFFLRTGLEQVFYYAVFQRCLRILESIIAGQHDTLQHGVQGHGALYQLQPGHTRQTNIRQEDIRHIIGHVVQRCDGVRAGGRQL